MPKEEFLRNLINEKKYKSYVEVGVWKGDNLFYIAENCPSLEVVIGIDPYSATIYQGSNETLSSVSKTTQEEFEEIYYEVQDKSYYSGIKILRCCSACAANGLVGNFDIVFIDGLHDYNAVKTDILAWLPKVKRGGILCGDDYGDIYVGVKQAVDEIFKEDLNLNNKVWYVFKEGEK
jgi:hypothetical protein